MASTPSRSKYSKLLAQAHSDYEQSGIPPPFIEATTTCTDDKKSQMVLAPTDSSTLCDVTKDCNYTMTLEAVLFGPGMWFWAFEQEGVKHIAKALKTNLLVESNVLTFYEYNGKGVRHYDGFGGTPVAYLRLDAMDDASVFQKSRAEDVCHHPMFRSTTRTTNNSSSTDYQAGTPSRAFKRVRSTVSELMLDTANGITDSPAPPSGRTAKTTSTHRDAEASAARSASNVLPQKNAVQGIDSKKSTAQKKIGHQKTQSSKPTVKACHNSGHPDDFTAALADLKARGEARKRPLQIKRQRVKPSPPTGPKPVETTTAGSIAVKSKPVEADPVESEPKEESLFVTSPSASPESSHRAKDDGPAQKPETSQNDMPPPPTPTLGQEPTTPRLSDGRPLLPAKPHNLKGQPHKRTRAQRTPETSGSGSQNSQIHHKRRDRQDSGDKVIARMKELLDEQVRIQNEQITLQSEQAKLMETLRQKSIASNGSWRPSNMDNNDPFRSPRLPASPSASVPRSIRIAEGMPRIALDPTICTSTYLTVSESCAPYSRTALVLHKCLRFGEFLCQVADIRGIELGQIARIVARIPDSSHSISIRKNAPDSLDYFIRRIHDDVYWERCSSKILMTIDVDVMAKEPNIAGFDADAA